MSYKHTKIAAYTVTIVAGMAASSLPGCSEYESNNYKNYTEASESGIIKRGWIPEFIPRSAYDIREKHKIDIAKIDVELTFAPADMDTFRNACSLREAGIYICENSGHPVEVVITGGNHAVIKSVGDGT